jgi:hypothetical protein
MYQQPNSFGESLVDYLPEKNPQAGAKIQVDMDEKGVKVVLTVLSRP